MGDAGKSELHTQILDRISAACIDGRCRNARYRQNQLNLLHAYLRSNADGICNAIRHDSDYTDVEASSEYYLTLSTITQVYNELDFEQMMKAERRIASGKSDGQRRVPHGIVLIRPGEYCRFFSIIAPLATAIAAGNCVLLELPPTLRILESFIREAFKAMDQDAFMVATQKISDKQFLSSCFVIDQRESSSRHTGAPHNSGVGLNIAVVHREANVALAAQSICTARFRFKGHSPYAPDIVLVNEWVKKDLVQAFLQVITENDATLLSMDEKADEKTKLSSPDPALNATTYKVLYRSARTQFLELKDRNPEKIYQIKGRTLVMLPITGLVDAVTMISNLSPLNACYIYASLKDAGFINQQIDSKITFVNEIPVRLLIGPVVANDTGHPSAQLQYDIAMMSKPQPAYLGTSSEADNITLEVLSTKKRTKAEVSKALDQLRARATTPLKPTGQASGTSMGFFDQGILTGVVAFVLPVLCLAGTGVFLAGRSAFRYLYA